MFHIQSIKLHLILFAAFVIAGCSSESGPVSIPVPFSGSLTANTNVAVADGEPVSGGETFPIVWNLFDGTSGASTGSVTFISMTDPVLTPISSGGEGRDFFLNMSATIGGGQIEAGASQAHCLDFPTTYAPSATLNTFASTVGGTAEVRKMVCSGNIDSGMGDITLGELMDFKALLGVVHFPDGRIQYHTQEESALLIHGTPFLFTSGNPAGKVLFTVVTQGFAAFVPPDPVEGEAPAFVASVNPALLPGSSEIVGTEVARFHSVDVSPDGLDVTINASVDFYLGGSFVRIHEVNQLTRVLPELNDPLDQLIQNSFLDDPNFNESIFTENGGVTTFPTISEVGPINCDPAANEATGIFRQFCEEFDEFSLEFRCLSKVNLDPSNTSVFTAEGVWVFSRP